MQVIRTFPASARAALAAFLSLSLSLSFPSPALADQNGAISAGPAAAAIINNRTVPDFVTRYAPLVHLHSADPYRPSDLLTHLQHTTAQLDFKPISGFDAPPVLNLDNLGNLNRFGNGGVDVALTSDDDVTDDPMAEWLLGVEPDADGRTRDATPCVVVLVERPERREVDAFYFYFYSYDRGGNISQVLEPVDRLVDLSKGKGGISFGDHVGDWEHNMVRFRDGKPKGIYFSQHSSGAAYKWGDRKVSKRDGRPIVYSAYGSHANYPTMGNNTHDSALIDWCDAGPIWDPVLSAYFFRYDPATSTVTPLSPPPTSTNTTTPTSTSFFYFTGRWGDRQYPESDPRQMIIPKFNLPRFQTGPTGPRAKWLVRKGLMPDHYPPRKTWQAWKIEWIIALWPCCIRGWRKWVSAAVLVVAAVGVMVVSVIGARFVVRRGRRVVDRWRRRGYQMVDGEEDWKYELEER